MACHCDKRGSIHLLIGPMFSGKSTELFRLTRRYLLAGKKTVVVKYAMDNRYDSEFACTHDLLKVNALSATHLRDVFDHLRDSAVVAIDEGQFFDDLVECADKLANDGKTVIIAALSGDFQRRPFPGIAQLLAIAEKIEKFSAICKGCGHCADFTHRTVHSKELEVIGGAEMYQAVCRACYVNFNRLRFAERDFTDANDAHE